LLTSGRYLAIEGRCDLCRKRDRDDFIKKQLERKKTREQLLDGTGTKVEELEETIREVKVEQDIELFEERGKLEVSDQQVKLVTQCKPPSLPTKVKKENVPQENSQDDTQAVKKQRTVRTGIGGGWIPVKWVAVNFEDETRDKADSAIGMDTARSTAKDPSKSGDSTSRVC
jgi:hypothetical protein